MLFSGDTLGGPDAAYKLVVSLGRSFSYEDMGVAAEIIKLLLE